MNKQQLYKHNGIDGHHEGNILGNLSLKVKKLLNLTGELKKIFKLQNVNLSLNSFLSNLKGSTSQERHPNKNISFRYIRNHNFSCI